MTSVMKGESYSYFSGISGLQLPVPKYKFPIEYQSSTRLTYYASLFNSIEINSSFYKIPMGKTVAKWAAEVPEHFKFTFKLWEGITHLKELRFSKTDIVKFIDVINHVESKKGCLLIQFPPGLKSNYADELIKLLDTIRFEDPMNSWPVAVEFRNKSWYNEKIDELLKSYHTSIVIHDKTGSALSSIRLDSNFVYLRFHGPTGDYRGSYNDEFLSEYAQYVVSWLKENRKVYVYFNNTLGGAIDNLNILNKYVKEELSNQY